MSTTMLAPSRLTLSSSGGGTSTDCAALCFTSAAKYETPALDPSSPAATVAGDLVSAERKAAFCCTGWFASRASHSGGGGTIDLVTVRTTDVGTLCTSALTESRVKLPDAAQVTADGNLIHSLVPCLSNFGRASDGRPCREFCVAVVVTPAPRSTEPQQQQQQAAATERARPGIVFIPVPGEQQLQLQQQQEAEDLSSRRERAFRRWLTTATSTKPPSSSSSPSSSSVDTSPSPTPSIFVPLPAAQCEGGVSREQTGALEDVTVWIPQISALLIGCENGTVVCVGPSAAATGTTTQSNPSSLLKGSMSLLHQDSAAGPVVQIAQCGTISSVDNGTTSSAIVVTLLINFYNKCILVDLKCQQQQAQAGNNNNSSFSFTALNVRTLKARQGPYGGCSLRPLPTAALVDLSFERQQQLAREPLESMILALRPNFRMFVTDPATGNGVKSLKMPQAPRVPGIRAIRDVTSLIDNRCFLPGDVSSSASSAAAPPCCFALCIARNQVCIMNCFALTYVAVQQLSSDVLNDLTENIANATTPMNSARGPPGGAAAQAAGSMLGDDDAGAGNPMMSGRMGTSSARQGAGGAGSGAFNAIDAALVSYGPSNIRSVHVLFGSFIVVLLRNGEISVLPLPAAAQHQQQRQHQQPQQVFGAPTEEFCAARVLPFVAASPPPPSVADVAAVETPVKAVQPGEGAVEQQPQVEQQQEKTPEKQQQVQPPNEDQQQPQQQQQEQVIVEAIKQQTPPKSVVEEQQHHEQQEPERVPSRSPTPPPPQAAVEVEAPEQQDEVTAPAVVVAVEDSPPPVKQEDPAQPAQAEQQQQSQPQQPEQQNKKDPPPATEKEKDKLEFWIETVENELIATADAPSITSKLAPLLSKSSFFSTLLEFVNDLCQRIRSVGAHVGKAGRRRNNGSRNNNSDNMGTDSLLLYNNNSSEEDAKRLRLTAVMDRIAVAVALCRRFTKVLPELFRIAHAELQKPLSDRRPGANLFLKDEFRPQLGALVVAPLCFFEYSSLHESFAVSSSFQQQQNSQQQDDGNSSNRSFGAEPAAASAVSRLDSTLDPFQRATWGRVSQAPPMPPTTNSSSSSKRPPPALQQRPAATEFHATETAEDIAFANATRSTFKLLRTLRLLTWPLAAVLIFILHRRRSLSMAVQLMEAFKGLAEADLIPRPGDNNNEAGTTPSSFSACNIPPSPIADGYLRRHPLPGCEPLVTKDSRRNPLPHLLSCAMLVARRVLRPSVPFLGACSIDLQTDVVDESSLDTTTTNNNTAQKLQVAQSVLPKGTAAAAATVSNFATLAQDVEQHLFAGDTAISNFFPPLPDVTTRAHAAPTSSLQLGRNAQAVSAAKKAATGGASGGGGGIGVAGLLGTPPPPHRGLNVELDGGNGDEGDNDDGDEDYYDNSTDEQQQQNMFAADIDNPLKSAINIFEACCTAPDALFLDYATHLVLTTVYLPFLNVVLPTKANFAAATQLQWDPHFDQGWLEWAVTCPKLREECFVFLSKHVKPTAPPMHKRIPVGMTMSAVLCDMLMLYLQPLHGDPRAFLALCPVQNGGQVSYAAGGGSVGAAAAAGRLNDWELDMVLARRFAWCVHVFLFEHATWYTKQMNVAAIAATSNSQRAYIESNCAVSTRSSVVSRGSPNSPTRWQAVNSAGSLASLASSPGTSSNLNRRPNNNNDPSDQAHEQRMLARRVRQINMWIEELITALKTFFAAYDSRAYAVLFRGMSELANAFQHGKALVDSDGFNSVVDRFVASGDVGGLLPLLQSMGSAGITVREWNYIFTVAKGAGLLIDAVHLAIAVENDMSKVKQLVRQAFSFLLRGASSHDPQLEEALDILAKLGAV